MQQTFMMFINEVCNMKDNEVVAPLTEAGIGVSIIISTRIMNSIIWKEIAMRTIFK